MPAHWHFDDPEHWRDRAEQVRALADLVTNEYAKTEILRIAAEYAYLAERADQRMRARKKKP